MELTLEALGLSREELAEKVVERAVAVLVGYDEEDGSSSLKRKLRDLFKSRIDKKVDQLAHEEVFPIVDKLVEDATLQATNNWGETVGRKMTFREYLVARAERYMLEDVNYEGKSKSEAGNFSFTRTQTRVSHLIERHLHYAIESAMKKALENANGQIVKGIEQTVKIKLEEIAKSLKVEAKLNN